MDKETELQDSSELEQELEEESQEESEETEQLTAEEIADLKKKAESSSQNFERLKKEQEKRKELEEKIKLLETSDDYADDDDAVNKKLAELNAKLQQIEEKGVLEKVYTDYPVVKDKLEEFEEFRQDYEGVAVDKVAKLFALEKGDYSPKRKGLEKAGGGTRTLPQSGKVSNDDIKRLRETNYKEYRKLLLAGKINIG